MISDGVNVLETPIPVMLKFGEKYACGFFFQDVHIFVSFYKKFIIFEMTAICKTNLLVSIFNFYFELELLIFIYFLLNCCIKQSEDI